MAGKMPKPAASHTECRSLQIVQDYGKRTVKVYEAAARTDEVVRAQAGLPNESTPY